MLMRGWLIVLAIIVGLHSAALGQATAPAVPSAASPAPAAVILVEGEINDYQYDFITRQFATAREAGARPSSSRSTATAGWSLPACRSPVSSSSRTI